MFLLMKPDQAPKTPDTMDAMSRLFDTLFRDKENQGEADFCAATPGYFQSLGIPLLRGRMFDDRDGPDSPHAALISESLSRARWPGQDPIGLTIEFGNIDGDLRLLTIVGIVGGSDVVALLTRICSVTGMPTYVSRVEMPARTSAAIA